MKAARGTTRRARLLWFLALWCAGVVSLAVVAWGIRLALGL